MWPFSSSSASPSATPSSSSIQTSSSYSSTLSPSTTPATSSVPPASTPTQAPDRHQRTLCWESRDAYFACLNTHNVLIAGTEGEGCVCEVERGEYGVHCGKSWIEYFNKRRTLEFRQKATLDAAEKQGVRTARSDRA